MIQVLSLVFEAPLLEHVERWIAPGGRTQPPVSRLHIESGEMTAPQFSRCSASTR